MFIDFDDRFQWFSIVFIRFSREWEATRNQAEPWKGYKNNWKSLKMVIQINEDIDPFFIFLITSNGKWMILLRFWIKQIKKIKKIKKTLPLFLAQAPSRSSRDGNGQFNYWHEIQIQSMHMALQIQTVAPSSSILRIDHFFKRMYKENTIDINHFLKRIWQEHRLWSLIQFNC